jgi:dolichyl-phosphate mannosyltransferase polypeptide 2 regulatory subunit
MYQTDRLVGLSMLIAATSVFVYYTVWTLFMVRPPNSHTLPNELSLL